MEKMRRLNTNKEGQNMTLGTIILIVLGVVVLVFLIWGFSTGWSNFWGRITAYTGSSNEDSVKSGCELICTGEQKIAYCTDVKTLKKGDGTTIKGSCQNFQTNSNIPGLTCNVDCAGTEYKQTCGDLGGEWKDNCGSGVATLTPAAKDTRSQEDIGKASQCCEK